MDLKRVSDVKEDPQPLFLFCQKWKAYWDRNGTFNPLPVKPDLKHGVKSPSLFLSVVSDYRWALEKSVCGKKTGIFSGMFLDFFLVLFNNNFNSNLCQMVSVPLLVFNLCLKRKPDPKQFLKVKYHDVW